jgi:hypothetical protein
MRRLALALAVAAVAVGFPAGAAAGWSLPIGHGSGAAKAKSLNAGNAPTLTNGTGHIVNVTWTASTYANGGSPQGYYVKRYNASTGVFVANACGGTLVTTLTCADGASKGSWTYTVTPATANWRGAESVKSAAISA